MFLATSVSSDIITAWKTKVISEESIEPHVNCLDVLIQNWIVFIKPLKEFDKTWKSNFYWQKCSYLCELDTWSSDLNTAVTLGECMFGAAKLTENSGKTWILWLLCWIWFTLTFFIVKWYVWYKCNYFWCSLMHSDNKKIYFCSLWSYKR